MSKRIINLSLQKGSTNFMDPKYVFKHLLLRWHMVVSYSKKNYNMNKLQHTIILKTI